MENCEICIQAGRSASVDVLVVGGGPSGIAAALSAARGGAKTLLVERQGFVGGMATAGLVGPFMTSYDVHGRTQVIRGIFDELVTRMEALGGAIHPGKIAPGSPYAAFIRKGHGNVTPFDPETLKIAAEELLLEAGVELQYYTQYLTSEVENGVIRRVLLAQKQGIVAIHPAVVVDCSGEADVARDCGVQVIMGRASDNIPQPATLFFRVAGVDAARVAQAIEDAKDLMGQPFYGAFSWLINEARANGDWSINRDELGCYMTPGGEIWNMNTSRMHGVDATDSRSLTRASIEGRRQMLEIHRFLRKYVPGFENCYIVDSAPVVGPRESVHIAGRYTVTREDVVGCKSFPDDVVLCSNSIDIHSDDGSGGEYLTVEKWYGIPYRALLPVGCDNLLVAGKTISATSEAVSAFRVMPCCFGFGQAAGTAAALAARGGIAPPQVNVEELQQTLISQGVFLDT